MARPDACRSPRAALRFAPLVLLAACTAMRPVALTPEARGARVRVTFAAPREVVLGRAGSPALRLPGVRHLEGRLAGRAGDTLVLRPVARALTADGAVTAEWLGREAEARVILEDGVAAAGTRRAVSGGRTVLLAVSVLALVVMFATAEMEWDQ